MIEAIVASLSVKVGSRLLKAVAENRDLDGADAGELLSSLLEAVVTGQAKANEDLVRLEKKVDALATDPYHAAMTAGTRLLSDAAPAHRRPEHRREMLTQARQAFAEAVGHAHGRALDTARAEVMYGLTWLALGSPEDLPAALARATRVLQLELITTFQLAARDERAYERHRSATSTKVREAVWGPVPQLPASSGSDRFWSAQEEHEAVWRLRLMVEGPPARVPRLVKPHGSSYSCARPGLPVRFDLAARQQLMDTFVTFGSGVVLVENLGAAPMRFAPTSLLFAADRVIRPIVSPLDDAGAWLPAGMQVERPLGSGSNAVCLSLGRGEGEDLAVLAHTSLDWSFRVERQLRLRR